MPRPSIACAARSTMARAWLLALAACGSSGTASTVVDQPAPPVKPIAPVVVEIGCRDLPAAACARVQQAAGARYRVDAPVGATRCASPDDPTRIGEWRYALVAPLYAPTENVADLAAVPVELGAATATIDALHLTTAKVLHDPTDRSTIATRARWTILPADELLPTWKVITVGNLHPLTSPDNALAIPICAPKSLGLPRIANIDPDALTVIAMTGTTAPTRYMARLMDQKGTTYPARDVAPWFAGVDFVHVSNEVSFTKACTKPGTIGMSFCGRESYIELLEAVHASIIELDGSHLIDTGTDAMANTLDMYESRGWHWFGGGRDQVDASKTLELEHHGNKIAFVGCNMPKTTSHVVRNGPNVAACDLDRVAWQIGDLRRRGFVPIVSIQHEEVYVHDPPDVIVRDFRKLADDGAAVVFGSQAHCAHPFEVVHQAFVHYGAGNFFFDQEGTNTRDGTVDRLYVHHNTLLTVGHLYTRLEENGRPRPLTDRERGQFLGELAHALGKLARTEPYADPHPVADTPGHPDSFLVGTAQEHVVVYPPTKLEPGKTYPLAIEPKAMFLPPAELDHYVVAPRRGTWDKRYIALARTFALARFPAIAR